MEESFGQIIHRKRLEFGLTLAEVAIRIRSHKGYISGIENEKMKPPSLKFVKRLARVLALDEIELLVLAHVEKAPLEIRTALREHAGMIVARAREYRRAVEKAAAKA